MSQLSTPFATFAARAQEQPSAQAETATAAALPMPSSGHATEPPVLGDEMRFEQLQQHLLSAVKRGWDEHRQAVRPAALIDLVQEKGWSDDEFAIRDALWELIKSRRLEVTADRSLLPAARADRR